jgi:hypothetical protein
VDRRICGFIASTIKGRRILIKIIEKGLGDPEIPALSIAS